MAKSEGYSPPDFIANCLKILRPPERLTVSEWAEKYRVLDSKSSAMPGKWSNSITPYLNDIMDEFNNPYSEEIIFVKPTQVGGTEVIINMLGYTVAQDPQPTMVVYPTDALAESISDNRVQPMLKLAQPTKSKFFKRASTKLELQCDGMYISLNGANSPSGLSSKPIGRLFMDEVDKYPTATKKEADPVKLARERTKTFPGRKIYITSTPTVESGHIWKALQTADQVKHYFVPCPHCGEYIELDFEHIQWPPKKDMSIADRAEFAYYACVKCGGVIDDQHKPQMLRMGRWQTVSGSETNAKIVAYWINTLYSPFVKWADIAKEFMTSKDDPEKLQNFRNSWLALPWQDVAAKTDADLVLDRQTELPAGTVPDWTQLLTAGVDVQRGSLYWSIRAWGEYLTSQNIAHGQAVGWDDIERIMNTEYLKQDGTPMIVALACVDSGDGDSTDEVYEFCNSNAEWAIPIKGSSVQLNYYKITTINRVGNAAHGTRLVLVDGAKYKDIIASRLNRPNGQGSFMVHADCDAEYAEQLTAEQKVNKRKAGRVVQVWEPKSSHADNHYLDCEVYAFCAADLNHVRNLHLQQAEPTPEPEPQQEEQIDWIGGGAYE